MIEIFTIPNISLLCQLSGAVILGWALAFTPDDIIKARAGTYWNMNPHFLNALIEQRYDALYGVIMLVIGYGLQLVENLFTLSNKISPEWTWKLAIAFFTIFSIIYFLTRRRHRYKKVIDLAHSSLKTSQEPNANME
ncbi:MAG: hypothetical protein ACOY15_07345 [Pseudomonadota bacterium]